MHVLECLTWAALGGVMLFVSPYLSDLGTVYFVATLVGTILFFGGLYKLAKTDCSECDPMAWRIHKACIVLSTVMVVGLGLVIIWIL